ncbi:MAG: hypothetical protein QME61_01725 [Patescibacteria group bacterium]|nr:hypothetical protein [Patescibacteria group bacterium]
MAKLIDQAYSKAIEILKAILLMGVSFQSWSAAGYILAYKSVKEGKINFLNAASFFANLIII